MMKLMLKTAIIILVIFVLLTSWFIPKYLKAGHVDTPCVKLVGGFYYCGKTHVMEEFLQKIKVDPGFHF